jgi:SRSO17 transposase
MSTILEHPEAQALLEQTTVTADDVRDLARRLTPFLQRYLPFFYRDEQRDHAATILHGKFTGLQRKTTEPIARQARQKRRPLQHFLGAGKWDDTALRQELCRHVREELADPQAVLVVDGYGVPKKGDDSCGVARQWCGHLGKVDNCQVGYFVAYVAPHGKALLDTRLYLTRERATDRRHRNLTYVPEGVTFQEGWRLSLELLENVCQELPHAWVVADDEFGRVIDFRRQLRQRRQAYVLDVPCDTLIRDLSERRPPSRPGGQPRRPEWERVDQWAARQPQKRWKKVRLRAGEKRPVVVQVLSQQVQTKDEGGAAGVRERLVVIRSCEPKPRTWYTLSWAAEEVPVAAVAAAHGQRHGIEELFEEGNGEVGMAQYEVRSWLGWAHHMTLSLLALWFLQLGRLRLGKKNTGDHGGPVAGDPDGVVAAAAAERGGNSRVGDGSAAA